MIVKDLLKECTREEFTNACLCGYSERLRERLSLKSAILQAWESLINASPVECKDILICFKVKDETLVSCIDRNETKNFFESNQSTSFPVGLLNLVWDDKTWDEIAGIEVDELSARRCGTVNALASIACGKIDEDRHEAGSILLDKSEILARPLNSAFEWPSMENIVTLIYVIRKAFDYTMGENGDNSINLPSPEEQLSVHSFIEKLTSRKNKAHEPGNGGISLDAELSALVDELCESKVLDKKDKDIFIDILMLIAPDYANPELGTYNDSETMLFDIDQAQDTAIKDYYNRELKSRH